MKTSVYVFLGGGTGSLLRYFIQIWCGKSNIENIFPLGTFLVNITGSLLIGLFYSLSAKTGLPQETRLLLTTGFCGGFTTFSTFSYNNLILLKNGFYSSFALYIFLSIIVGISFTWIGAWLGKTLF